MNFQQLRSIREAARCGYNLTEVANVLFTSQPGVSRQIRELEDELGVEIFERNGKRLTGLTEPGAEILQIVDKLLIEAENLTQAAREYAGRTTGTLTIATTHTQARYMLPPVIQTFRRQFPDVRVALQQSSPEHIADWVMSGKADIGIATEGLSQFKELSSFACYEWHHTLVVPDGHPLLALPQVTLANIALHPVITYDRGFTGRGHIDDAFARAGIAPDIVLTAMDSDVIKTYVGLDLGIGLVAGMAFDPQRDSGLRSIDVTHCFAPNITRLALRKGAYVRAYSYAFIEMFAPHLQRKMLEKALAEAA
ncbi:MAG TPA: CysB family HTH-type transcriptional regulator [Burkholderiaceae bacterium]|nr:CysB family HTH-type transcriptional regulator [Burkholderiaceae bacterium]